METIILDEIDMPKGAVDELIRRLITEPQGLPESVRRRFFVISGNNIRAGNNIQADDEEPAGSHEDWRRLNE
ncbi:MAG TPA: hypothetical protein VGF39_17850 [Stellaceae bacterium]